ARAVRARGIERRNHITEAAAAFAMEHGIAAISHRQVAAAAQVPLGSTTYYFSSLDELRAAAVERILIGDRERRRAAIGQGLASDVSATDLAWALIDAVVSIPRLDDPIQVALLYERIAEAVRAPELAAVLRAASKEVLADIETLTAGTDWADSDAAALLALVDGRVIGWLALGDTRPVLLLEGIASDLARHQG
ncbi:MAG: TetR family transcriptional regulator, partial [Solirubrobacteraceae bacterium]|nr:TetR family transcriptional regulator [Solirubrobacteraceae bacterium]